MYHGGFFLNWQMIVWRLRIQELKIGNWEDFEKIEFFSLFLMRKRLTSGQKWFLRPYFIGVCLYLEVVLDFRLGHWKCPNRDWGKGHFSKWKWPFRKIYILDLRNEDLRHIFYEKLVSGGFLPARSKKIFSLMIWIGIFLAFVQKNSENRKPSKNVSFRKCDFSGT